MIHRFRFLLVGLAVMLVLSTLVIVNGQDAKILLVASGPGDPRSIDPQAAINTRDWTLLNLLFPALTTLACWIG